LTEESEIKQVFNGLCRKCQLDFFYTEKQKTAGFSVFVFMKGEHKVKNRIILGSIVTILGLMLAAGPWYIFKVCGSSMKCFWTGRAELGIGVLIIILGILNMVVSSIQVRLGLNLALIFVGILSALIPTWLIRVCSMPKMNCHAVAAPSILFISILVTLLALGNVFYLFSLGKKTEGQL
jgi:hypothetical protein